MYSPINDKTYSTTDIAFKTPFTINIIGPSKCGKTSLVSDFLENHNNESFSSKDYIVLFIIPASF